MNRQVTENPETTRIVPGDTRITITITMPELLKILRAEDAKVPDDDEAVLSTTFIRSYGTDSVLHLNFIAHAT